LVLRSGTAVSCANAVAAMAKKAAHLRLFDTATIYHQNQARR
jgi:hypothetical protein